MTNMIDIAWFIPVVYFSLLLGTVVTLSTWIMHDKRKEKRLDKIIADNESWCQKNCKNAEWCGENYKDPDDAQDALEDFCINCPMRRAFEIIERDNLTKKRGKQ